MSGVGMAGMTIVEKILARAAGASRLFPDEVVVVAVDLAMSHENADVVRKAFLEIGKDRVWDPSKIVIILDHRIPAESEKTAATHMAIRRFVAEQGIEHFYDVGRGGICHQVLAENGHVWPGQVLVGTDSHTTTHGAFGAFATGIGATEMAGVWAEGELWFKVPATIKVHISGTMAPHVSAKDVILYIIGKLGADGADYRAVEFCGHSIDRMTMSSRMVMTNLAMEMGAKVAFMPVDAVLLDFLSGRVKQDFDKTLRPDKDAEYERVVCIDLDKEVREPYLSCPHCVDNVKAISELEGIRIDQAVLGSCTNGRIEDLEVAARVLNGRRIDKRVRLIVIPASQMVYLKALDMGLIRVFVEAGAVVNPPGCGPCLGAHQGLLAPGEVAVASTNRNFMGRMGSKDAFVYLASPEVVAASALKGRLTHPAKI